MTSVHDIESALWQLAPRELARSWDNVGLLVGRPDREVRRVLVALDMDGHTLEEWRDLVELMKAGNVSEI